MPLGSPGPWQSLLGQEREATVDVLRDVNATARAKLFENVYCLNWAGLSSAHLSCCAFPLSQWINPCWSATGINEVTPHIIVGGQSSLGFLARKGSCLNRWLLQGREMNPLYRLLTRYSEVPWADAGGDDVWQHVNFWSPQRAALPTQNCSQTLILRSPWLDLVSPSSVRVYSVSGSLLLVPWVSLSFKSTSSLEISIKKLSFTC